MKVTSTTLKTRNFIVLYLIVALLAACSKNNIGPDNPQPGPANSTDQNIIKTPTLLNLQLGYINGHTFPTRLTLPITKIGNQNVNIKTVFDTGSEGLVLKAEHVISPSLITPDGINLNGQDQMDVNGITITSTKATTGYGSGVNIRVFYGQVAYASITIGDTNGHVVTRSMPFLLIYKGISKPSGNATSLDAALDGICGVGSPKGLPTQDTSKSNRRSPFAYINYGNGVIPGFKLQAYETFFNSTIPGQATAGSLQLANAPILQIGLTTNTEQGFTLQQKPVLNNGQSVSTYVTGKFTIGSNSFNAEILFDTGTPQGVNISFPESLGLSQSQPLNAQTKVNFTSDEGYHYNYLADQTSWKTQINPAVNIGRSIVGLQFFANTSFLIDFNNHFIGLKAL